MKKMFSVYKGSLAWLLNAVMFFWAAVLLLFRYPWYMAAGFAVICTAVFVILNRREQKSAHDFAAVEKELKRALKKASQNGDAMSLYRILENKGLPELRKRMPTKVYKYFSLGNGDVKDGQRLETVANNKLWSSVPTGFNDPFECEYMYISEKELGEIGFPPNTMQKALNLWETLIGAIRERITIVCFTQNPNDMPMWAHYANEHKGFCVEYEIDDPSKLYPVFYTDKRLPAQALFVNLIYSFFNSDVPDDDRRLLLNHIVLLSAFKDKSWSAENEIRAIFLNGRANLSGKGRLCSCEEIGIHPTRLFIGVNCSPDNEKRLIDLSEKLQIEYEKCELSSNKFAVVRSH